MLTCPPLPPFTHETAVLKVRLAEDGWNSRDPEKVALALHAKLRWRNRSEFVNGRQEIVAFQKLYIDDYINQLKLKANQQTEKETMNNQRIPSIDPSTATGTNKKNFHLFKFRAGSDT
jgi:Protein of unknown function (DUF1348)